MLWILAPYPDWKMNAETFCKTDLRYQIEAIYRTSKCVLGLEDAWGHDTAIQFNTAVWTDKVLALLTYGQILCDQLPTDWAKDKRRIFEYFIHTASLTEDQELGSPPWWGRSEIHAAHRSYLVHWNPNHYGPIWPDVLPQFAPIPAPALVAYL